MKLTLPAYAKINLTLEVLGQRHDGYHQVSSVLQTIELADTLSFQLADEISLKCNLPGLSSPANAVLMAARLLQEQTGVEGGCLIDLDKRIPISSGLGGHSADEACALRGLDQLWGLNLSQHRLLELASRLSSDTAFFVYGGTALVEGRGDQVTPLPPPAPTWLVLLKPAIEPVANKTQRLYRRLSASHFTQGHLSQRLVGHLSGGGVVAPELLFNIFEFVAFDFFPELAWYRSRLLQAGAQSVHLAGSGPALFTLVPDQARGEAVLGQLKGAELEAYLVRTIAPSPTLHRAE